MVFLWEVYSFSLEFSLHFQQPFAISLFSYPDPLGSDRNQSFTTVTVKMAALEGYRFGQHILKSSVVFFRSKLTFGFVNRKPVVPGHVLLSPVRVVERFCDLSEDEVADLFLSTQKIARVVEKHFKASSLTIAVQDGPDAGQTVRHVHVHILPRRKGDFSENDDIYKVLEKHDKVELQENTDEDSRFRSQHEMANEACELATFFN